MIGRDPPNLKSRDLKLWNVKRWGRFQSLLAWGSDPQRGPLPVKVLVVAWSATGVSIAVYQRSGLGQQTRLESFDVEWSEEQQHSVDVIGGLISRELRERKISVQDVVASVPRRFVVLKNLELPPAERASIANIVHLQCENLFPVSRTTLEIDYLQHESPADSDTSILVCAVPKPVIQLVLGALRHAGLKPYAVGIGELGIPFLSPPIGSDALQFDVLANGNKFEFLISRNQLPVISHAGQAPELETERVRYVCSTMNRLLQAAAQRLPELQTTRINAFGDFNDETAIEMRRVMQIPIQYHVEATPREIMDLSLLAACEQPDRSIDFLNPRKPVDPAIEFQRKVFSYSTIAAALIILFGLPLTWSNYRLDRQLARIKRDKADLAIQVERLEPLEKTWKKLVAFERARVDYASELTDILNRFQPREQMHLEKLEMGEASGSGVVVMRFVGRVKDREAWTNLTNDLLVATDRYRLRAPLLEQVTGDGQYSFKFTLELELKSAYSEHNLAGT